MAEGLALAASVIAVVQITNSLISVCYDYSAAMKGASWQLPRIKSELESLRNVLQQLEPLAKQAELAPAAADLKLPAFAQLCGSEGLLQLCYAEVKELEVKLKTPSWSDGFGPRRKALVQVLQWPLREADTEKALKQIGRFRDMLNFALTADQAALSLEMQKLLQSTNAAISDPQHGLESIQQTNMKTQKKVDSMKGFISEVDDKVEVLQLETRRKAICKWLSAPDPSTNYNRGRRSRQANTGIWFIESKEFSRWKCSSGSMLWLYGKPGCGKSVMSSTIISEVLNEHQSGHRTAVAYFFFDFNDSQKQKPEHMIRTLINQLFTNTPGALAILESLFVNCGEGQRQPDLESLMRVLKTIFCEALQVYVVVDALDECCDIYELLSILVEIQSWKIPQLHILLTSRRLTAIEDSIKNFVGSPLRIDVQSKLVDQDISAYVSDRLLFDPELQRWRRSPSVQEEIRSVLTGKADGMFRWAVCQLDTLQHCPNLPTLRKALRSLPKTLDETYARILHDIPEEYSNYAISILRWLTFCARPLKLCELVEVITVNIEGEPWADETLRFPEPKDLLAICSSLLKVDDSDDNQELQHSAIRLAHFSVKEYLVSERIQNQTAASFSLEEISSHEIIASTCLAYLLTFNGSNCLQSPGYRTIRKSNPLIEYACSYWTNHAREAGLQIDVLKRLSLQFFRPECEAYGVWLDFLGNELTEFCNLPLCQMASHGVVCLVDLLLEQGAEVNHVDENGTALWAASNMGYEAVVRALLRYGADVDIEHTEYGTPLQAACRVADMGTVYALLDAGASINHESGDYGTALQAAVWGGNLEIVQLLTRKGADVNPSGVGPCSPLIVACIEDHFQIAQHLVQAGADPNFQECQSLTSSQTSLQATCASRGANIKLVELLLKNNADVNALGGRYGTALQAACSYHDNLKVIRLLLEQGADIHIQAGKYSTPLQAVCAENHDNVDLVAFLLEKGVGINAQGGKYCTALQAACRSANRRIVKLLLERGADSNIIGGKFGSALLATCAENFEEIATFLLEAGADPNIHVGTVGTALQAASAKNYAGIVALLLKKGANVNAPGGKHGTALKATLNLKSKYDTTHLTKLLLEHGAKEDDLSVVEREKLEFVKQLYEIPVC